VLIVEAANQGENFDWCAHDDLLLAAHFAMPGRSVADAIVITDDFTRWRNCSTDSKRIRGNQTENPFAPVRVGGQRRESAWR
jgi:hypothetical protein